MSRKLKTTLFLLFCILLLVLLLRLDSVPFPNIVELICLVVVGGIGLFIGVGILVILFEDWKHSPPSGEGGKRNIVKRGLIALIGICLIYLHIVSRVSLNEGRIIINIFTTERGKVYVTATLLLLVLAIIYSIYIFMKKGRWQRGEEFDAIAKSVKSRQLTPKESVLGFVAGLIIIAIVVTLLAVYRL